jgi:hypothetical protein
MRLADIKLFPSLGTYLIVSEQSKVDTGNGSHGERESLASKTEESCALHLGRFD